MADLTQELIGNGGSYSGLDLDNRQLLVDIVNGDNVAVNDNDPAAPPADANMIVDDDSDDEDEDDDSDDTEFYDESESD